MTNFNTTEGCALELFIIILECKFHGCLLC